MSYSYFKHFIIGIFIVFYNLANAQIIQPDSLSLCSNSSDYFSLQPTLNGILAWQDSTSTGWAFLNNNVNYNGVNNDTIQLNNLTAGPNNYYFRCLADTNSDGLFDLYSNKVKVVIFPVLVRGIVTSSQDICYNGIPSTLSLTTLPSGGGNNFAHQWQSSINGINWTLINPLEIGTSYSIGNLSTTTYYRLISSSTAGCGSISSDSVKVNVYSPLTPGVIGGNQAICYNSVPSAITFTTLPSGANGLYSYQWQSSTDNITFNNVAGATSNFYQPPVLTQTVYYRVIVTSQLGCGSVITNSRMITVYSPFVRGTIIGNDTVCYNSAPGLLQFSNLPSGGNGVYTYQWLQSPNQTIWSVVSSQTSITYQPPSLTSDMYFKLKVTSGQGCGVDSTNSIKIKVWPNKQKAIIIGNQSICYNAQSDTIKVSQLATGADGNFSYQWQSSINGTSWTSIVGQTNIKYLPAPLTISTFYRVIATSIFGCGSISSDSVKVNVYSPLTPGVIGGNQAICYNSVPSAITFTTLPSGANGLYSYQWQSSTDNITFNNVAGATSNFYQPPVLTQTVYYRVIVTSQLGCGSVITNSRMITVYSPFVRGTIIGNDTVCYNSAPGLLQFSNLPSGGNGVYTYQWLQSPNQTIWSVVSSQTSITYQPPSLTSDMYFKLKVTSGQGCGVDSTNSIKIKVWPNKQKAIIIGNQSICYNAQSDTIKVSQLATGADGNFSYQWQSSINGTSWTSIVGQTNIKYLPAPLTISTFYRVIATSIFGCGSISSDSVKVNVYSPLTPGVIGGNQAICYNSVPSAITFTTLPSGANGLYSYQWQSSTDNITFNNVAGATSNFYQPPVLTQTVYYRVIVTSQLGCGSVITNSRMITVYSPFVRGTIIGNDTVCYNSAPGLLQFSNLPSGGNGVYTYQWLQSPNQTIWSVVSSQTSITYQPPSLTSDMYFKLKVTSGQGCGVDSTNSIKIKVWPNKQKAIIIGNQSICYNAQSDTIKVSQLATGADGNFSYQWQSSINGTSWTSIVGQTNIKYLPAPLTISTFYRVIATSIFGCGSISSDSVKVNVYSPLTPGVIGGNQAICYNSVPSAITFTTLPSGANGLYSYQWQSSTDNITFNNVAGATSNFYQPPVLTQTVYYRVIVTSQLGCGSVITNSRMITVYSPFVRGTIIGNDTVCYNSAPGLLQFSNLPSGGNGVYTYQWLQSPNQTIWSVVSSQTSITYQPPSLTSDMYFKLKVTSGQGCGVDSTNSIKIIVNPLPDTVSVIGLNLVCLNQADVHYNFLNYNFSTTSYNWNLNNGYIQTGSHNNETIITWNQSGYDTLRLTQTFNSTGCFNIMTFPVEVSANAAPNKCTIIRKPNTNILICSDTTLNIQYQWGYTVKSTLTDVLIPNATLQYVLLPHAFDTTLYYYFVITNYYFGNSSCSARTEYNRPELILGISNQQMDLGSFVVYPNPSSGSINLPDLNKGDIIHIMDLNGRKIKYKLNNKYLQLEDDFDNGVYILQVINKSEVKNFKIVFSK